MKRNIVSAVLIGAVALVAAVVIAQEVPKYISGGQVIANFQKGGPYGGSYTGGTFLIYSSLPSYIALQNVAGGAVQANSVGYTTTVAKAASAVQPTDATYTATVAKAASAVQPTDATYTSTVAKADGALQAAAGKSVTNTWISGPADSVTNVQVFINGQLISWSTNGIAL